MMFSNDKDVRCMPMINLIVIESSFYQPLFTKKICSYKQIFLKHSVIFMITVHIGVRLR